MSAAPVGSIARAGLGSNYGPAYHVACPWCHAKAGYLCWTSGGQGRVDPHADRLAAADAEAAS